ncbi:MAG TPA: VanZ family protein [Candidatus Krumholzibacteria bacterium]|nr:VanZ family protein [Candidatus Krumholzibacteria bacterium]
MGRTRNRTARGNALWIVLTVAYVGLIFFMSSRPYLNAPGPDFDMKDKLIHATEYGILGLLVVRALGNTLSRSRVVTVFFVIAVCATIAGVDEFFQGTVPGRQKDILDWLADVTGVTIGAALTLWRVRPRRGGKETQA